MTRRLLLLAIAMLVPGCLHVGEASESEKDQLAKWSAAVTQKDREEVTQAANAHTDWLEKKKVQYMTSEYRSRYAKAQAKKRTTQPSTRPTSTPFWGVGG